MNIKILPTARNVDLSKYSSNGGGKMQAMQGYKPSPPQQGTPHQMRKIFIGGLPFHCSRDILYSYFAQFGTVLDAAVMVDSETRIPRGFGFITFAKEESVHATMLSRPHNLLGKTIDVKRAIPKQQLAQEFPTPNFNFSPNPGTKLLISAMLNPANMPVDWGYSTIKLLHEYFSQFGEMEQIEKTVDGERFIVFEKREAAAECLDFNGGKHCFNNITIKLKACTEPGDSEADIDSA